MKRDDLANLDALYTAIDAPAPAGLGGTFWRDRCIENFERAVVRLWPTIRKAIEPSLFTNVVSDSPPSRVGRTRRAAVSDFRRRAGTSGNVQAGR